MRNAHESLTHTHTHKSCLSKIKNIRIFFTNAKVKLGKKIHFLIIIIHNIYAPLKNMLAIGNYFFSFKLTFSNSFALLPTI